MTVPNTQTQSGPLFPNGATTAFPFTFKAASKSEVQFIRIEADGSETIISDALYSVSLTALPGVGGSINFFVAPAASALQHYVRSNPSFLQNISFENEGAFLPEVVSEALDRAAIRTLVSRSAATARWSRRAARSG